MADTLKQFYDDLPLGVCILERSRKHMRILHANIVMSSMFGVRSDDALKELTFDEAWPMPEAAKLVADLKKTNPPSSYILPLQLTIDSPKQWIKLNITQDKWGGAECFVLFATDISANKEAEERLSRAVEEADAVAEVKANFLATMSHEIRTPMQSIYGLLELIGEEKPPEKIGEMASIAKSSASNLLEILDDILDFAKMDADKMELDVFEVPVRMLVRGTLEALAVKVHGRDIDIIDEIEDPVPFVVIGDPKRLRQIIMNLVGNAIKFTDRGYVKVHVSTQPQHIEVHDKQVGLRFEIIDTGMGMPPEVCDKLFQSFTQADNTTSRKFGGTGLGLSICKKLVELMGGKIGVESTVGKGSTFWFEIATEEVGIGRSTIELPNLDGISVLSVEDHPQGAQEIKSALTSMGATVESCPTYADGLAMAQHRPFDVAVIDQGLPDGLGYDLIREIMEIRPGIGFVMYTVRDDAGLQHSLQAIGATYLAKPASRAGLGEAVSAIASSNVSIDRDGPQGLLIAEDTQSVRDILARQLDKLGVEADFVGNGAEALTALESGQYGILITDLHMPEIDGYEVVQTIRKREDGTDTHFPVIALTADVQLAQKSSYMEHGFDECLLKPVSIGQFKRLLLRWGLFDPAADPTMSQDNHQEEKSPIHETNENTEMTNETPAIDVNAMRELMGSFDDGTIEMLHAFIEMTEPVIGQILEAQEHNDPETLKELGHSLKGSARSACCPVLGDFAASLQDEAGERNETGHIVEKIQAEFERVKDTIPSLQPD